VLEVIGEPESAFDHVLEILLRVLVPFDLVPVLGGVLVVLPHPGGDGCFRDVEPGPDEEVQQVPGHMLDPVDMPDDDEADHLVPDQPVPEPGVLVLDGIHPLDELLDEGRMVVPPDRGREDQDIGGEHRVVDLLHLVVVILE